LESEPKWPTLNNSKRGRMLSEDEEIKNEIEEETPQEEPAEEMKQEEPAEETEKVEIPETVETAETVEAGKGVPEDGLLMPRDTLLSAGIHIGTRMKTGDMEQFIYRVRPDGLFVLDVKKTDDRIRVAAKFLARFEPAKTAAAAGRLYAQEPVSKFCQVTGATAIVGRFIPGLLSNPLYPNRIEPEVLIVSDPRADFQAVKEAGAIGIPVVALCSTDNEFVGVDYVIPTNNKGRRALAVIYWLLARQILKERGELAADKELPLTVDDFEAKISREEEEV
jgi:small subunit ribosomal protein S2